ncbi:MAG: DUF4270 domain-containing protein [Bacteroidia bacterium]|nr:DUF4270 domain-containing protein [Bacteroidia bacterium]
MKRFIGVALLLWAIACRNPQRGGEAVFPPPPTQVDTLRLSTIRQVFLTPPSTTKAPFVFIGETEDTLMGRWQAGWATQFALGGENVQFYATELVAVDSVILELFVASSYGNIGTPLRVKVSRLTQPLTSGTSYPPDATFPTDGQNLTLPGRDTLTYTTFTAGVVRFALDPSLGRQILPLPSSALANQATFQSAFPGLYITAEPFQAGASAAVYTLFPRSPSTALRIYYRERLQGQEVPQRYDFYITDTCTWAYRLVRSVNGPLPLRDQLEQDSTLWRERLLVAGGLPVGIAFTVQGWEQIARRPVLSARLLWPSDSSTAAAFNAFYPRPNSFSLYADTTEEAATAAWGFGEFVGEAAVWDLTQPIQEVALGRRTPPQWLYLWTTGRTYTLHRWVAAGLQSRTPPYLIVISAEP